MTAIGTQMKYVLRDGRATGGGGTTGGATASDPQFGQKRAPGGNSVPQFEQ